MKLHVTWLAFKSHFLPHFLSQLRSAPVYLSKQGGTQKSGCALVARLMKGGGGDEERAEGKRAQECMQVSMREKV